jgi:Family of unknown function (DUF5681)
MAVTERALANLKPFQPGVSGNPKGRPKGFNLQTAMQKLAPKAARKLATMLDSDDGKEVLAAVREILNRGYGTPAQSMVVTGEVTHEHTHVLTREQLLAIASGQEPREEVIDVEFADTEEGTDTGAGDNGADGDAAAEDAPTP